MARIRAKCHGVTESLFSAAKVTMQLKRCLKGKAELQYTKEKSNITRACLNTGIEDWCDELKFHLHLSPGVALEKLESLEYTIADIRRHKDLEDFVQADTYRTFPLCLTKNTRLNFNSRHWPHHLYATTGRDK
ncbi:hypothetical protein GcM3_041025 [Golovinomyces cichoracearum]|uniref:Uncharacterized protein n=1 Tax=Golovinomyces cichoracearum TaxID=62708 RepID=A0A420J269_9PEZI|nr:hypothetical protein GcM3_041025 [Golovinomyces cichoracearum]